jgi:hypothetical protein
MHSLDQAHLPLGVDAGVRAAGPLHMSPAAQHGGRRVTEHPLNRPETRLNLPAVVVRAVVGDHQLDPPPDRLRIRFIRDRHLPYPALQREAQCTSAFLSS